MSPQPSVDCRDVQSKASAHLNCGGEHQHRTGKHQQRRRPPRGRGGGGGSISCQGEASIRGVHLRLASVAAHVQPRHSWCHPLDVRCDQVVECLLNKRAVVLHVVGEHEVRLHDHRRDVVLLAVGEQLRLARRRERLVAQVLDAKAQHYGQVGGLRLAEVLGLVLVARLVGVVLAEIDHRHTRAARELLLHRHPVVVQPTRICSRETSSIQASQLKPHAVWLHLPVSRPL
jgi:hypothetical protein